jgi:hypothetical protein
MEPCFSAQVFPGRGVRILPARGVAAATAPGIQSRKDQTMQTRSPSFLGSPPVAGGPASCAEFAGA